MSKQYEKLAESIISDIGGTDNINNAYHCQTRLRFALNDEGKADIPALENLDGVVKVMVNGGTFQVVIGTHVASVFEEIEKLLGPSFRSNQEGSEEHKEKKSIMGTVIDFVAGTFQPIIPALSGAGMLKALLALLTVFNIITTDSQTYYMINLFSDAVFYFLPILLAFTEAQKLKCNPILAAGVAAMMLHPNWSSLVSAGEPVYYFGVIPFTLATYTSSVIPILLVVLVQSYVEKWLEKVIPNSVKLVFVPMLTFLIMGTLAFSILGPIGSIVGNWLAVFFTFLSTNAAWAPSVLIGALCPIMVMFGLHNGIAPLGVMQMADLGYDSIWGPGCLCSNMAQATAALVVGLRTKETRLKEIALSGSITAYMGITEPVLYGVNLPKKYPLIAAMIGGGFGGLYAGLTQTHRFATGSSGLPAVLLYIGDNTMQYLINILIAIAISVVITGVLTYILSLRYEKAEDTDKTEASETGTDETGTAVTADVKAADIAAPVPGKIIPLVDIGDGVFSEGVLGQGFGIEPEEGSVYAPFDGKVVLIPDTKHAIALESSDGAEVLIHVGIDTVDLKGEGFTPLVSVGDQVKAGQKLMDFDLDKIGEKYRTTTAVIVTNSNHYKKFDLVKTGPTDAITAVQPVLQLS
ncbi:MAG: beta-glucoside-specific PTS transporter subunit IIABC [Eubacteriaceae bacterium]|jgi:PTS system beta-glucosides-specific IIC component